MEKIYKVEMYIVDYNGSYQNFDNLMIDLERNSEAFLIPHNVKVKEIEWNDNIDLNHKSDLETCRKYFEEQIILSMGIPPSLLEMLELNTETESKIVADIAIQKIVKKLNGGL